MTVKNGYGNTVAGRTHGEQQSSTRKDASESRRFFQGEPHGDHPDVA